MKTKTIIKKYIISVWLLCNILVISLYLSGCLEDSGPYYIEPKPEPKPIVPEICECDKTPFRDCYCDQDDPLPCECNKTSYREPDCPCDTLDPVCPCDSTPYMDCHCDNYDPVYNCPCDSTPYRDCLCDTMQPIYTCPCGEATKWWDCQCDKDPVYKCDCDTSKYYDCTCDRDTEIRPIENKKLSFAKDIQPIFNKHCVNCHYSGVSVPDYSSPEGYSTITGAYINKGYPEASKIYTIIVDGEMPPADVKIPDSDLEKILQWIKDGALE